MFDQEIVNETTDVIDNIISTAKQTQRVAPDPTTSEFIKASQDGETNNEQSVNLKINHEFGEAPKKKGKKIVLPPEPFLQVKEKEITQKKGR